MLLLRDEHIQAAMNQGGFLDDFQTMLSRPSGAGLELVPRLTIDAKGDRGFLRLMPVIAYGVGYAGYKAMNYHPVHGVRYLISLTSLETGELEAILDADWITAQRTAATAAIAVRHLARPGAERMAVLGSGTQARALLCAANEVLRPSLVEVFSPTEANRRWFAGEMREDLGLDVRATGDLTGALRRADVVLSAFRAGSEPVIFANAVREGTLVCGISSVRPHQREVDVSLWNESRVVVDDKEHVCESGDGRAIGLEPDDPAVNELWEILQQPSLRRTNADERILFKSVGTAEQDIALAAIVLQRARVMGLGEDLGEFPNVRPIQRPRPVAAEATVG